MIRAIPHLAYAVALLTFISQNAITLGGDDPE
jgi:hypothetical protein